LLWWVVFGMTMIHFQQPDFWLRVLTLGSLVAAGDAVQIGGAVAMLRGRGYPWAGAAAILATIPCSPSWLLGLPCGIWAISPSWLLGLPFGIWAIIVLGKPEVTQAFLGDQRRVESGPAPARFKRIGIAIARRFLSMFRSFVGYTLPTMPGRKPT